MASIDARALGGAGVVHKHMTFSGAVVATALATAIGTGITICPLRMRWHASNAGSVVLTIGSSLASIFRSQFLANNVNQETPWWDTTLTANTGIFIEIPSAVGRGEFDIWFTVVRGGAGSGALNQ